LFAAVVLSAALVVKLQRLNSRQPVFLNQDRPVEQSTQDFIRHNRRVEPIDRTASLETTLNF
jgi:hypothetical protein